MIREAVPPQSGAAVGRLFRRAGLVDFSREQMRFLSYGRGLDTRRMREVLGFAPAYTTQQAFMDFVSGRDLHGPLSPDAVGRLEQRALSALPGVRGLSRAGLALPGVPGLSRAGRPV